MKSTFLVLALLTGMAKADTKLPRPKHALYAVLSRHLITGNTSDYRVMCLKAGTAKCAVRKYDGNTIVREADIDRAQATKWLKDLQGSLTKNPPKDSNPRLSWRIRLDNDYFDGSVGDGSFKTGSDREVGRLAFLTLETKMLAYLEEKGREPAALAPKKRKAK